MEIASASASAVATTKATIHSRLFQFRTIHSSLSFSTKARHRHGFSSAFRKCLTSTTRALPDETIATTQVAVTDTSLAVKKRAADLSPELKGTSIFLVGMKSPLKTDLGKLLADALRYYYFDSDSLVEEAAGGETAAKLYRESDEKGFREAETEVLKQLSSMGRLVVCAGDGAVQSSTNLALLRHGISLWIEVPFDNESQPEESDELLAKYEDLRGGYATADAKISLQKVAVKLGYNDLDSVTTEDMTLEVLKEIEKLTRTKKMMEEAARPF